MLWVLLAAAELLLLARILSVLIWGINGDLSAPANAPGWLYSLTGILVDDLNQASNFLVPYAGIRHALDITAIMAMLILFFAVLLITKAAMWVAQQKNDRTPLLSSR